MTVEGTSIRLYTSGTGIIFHSPRATEHFREGEDYLTSHYATEEQVQSHIQRGSLVAFGTGSPGTFTLKFHDGYPKDSEMLEAEFRLRLGLCCTGEQVHFRDLYELLDWQPDCPPEQVLELMDGYYHVTLLSSRPTSGIIGDDQTVHFYLQKLDAFPALSTQGIPALC